MEKKREVKYQQKHSYTSDSSVEILQVIEPPYKRHKENHPPHSAPTTNLVSLDFDDSWTIQQICNSVGLHPAHKATHSKKGLRDPLANFQSAEADFVLCTSSFEVVCTRDLGVLKSKKKQVAREKPLFIYRY